MTSPSTDTTLTRAIGVAALSTPLQHGADGEWQPPTAVRLVPAGEFRARDGRPADVSAWRMTPALAQPVIAYARAQTDDPVIDYEHQTLHAMTNGQPAPAAGWWTAAGMEWRDGEQPGLWATDLTWTPRALEMLRAREYRYFSPVIAYDASTGDVMAVLMGALTNHAAVDGLSDLASAALSWWGERCTPLYMEPSMSENELRDDVIRFLRLPITTTDAELRAELAKLAAMITASGADATAPLATILQGQATQLATLTAQIAAAQTAVDPSAYVPVEVHREAIAALRATQTAGTADAISRLIAEGLADGRIPGQATAKWLQAQGLAALTSYLQDAPAVAALTRTQVPHGAAPVDDPAALTPAERAVAKGLGLSDDAYRAARGGEA